jgi:hypothetical protein
MLYQQCLLRKGNLIEVAWIPKRFTVVGKALVIKNVDGWIVREVYAPELEYDTVNLNSRDWTRTRAVSDI